MGSEMCIRDSHDAPLGVSGMRDLTGNVCANNADFTGFHSEAPIFKAEVRSVDSPSSPTC